MVGASATQFNRHITRLPKYVEADEVVPLEFTEFDFNCLGSIQRTKESITDAASKLSLDLDKMSAAMFWFYKGNTITDEPAFDLLKDGNVRDAVAIWAKLTNEKEVDSKNASAYQNLSTLLLHSAIKEKNIKDELLEKGLRLKLKFLDSEFVKDFKVNTTDSTFRTTKNQLQLMFLNIVTSEIENKANFANSKLIEIISKLTFSAKESFFSDYIKSLINQVEQRVEETKSKRLSNKFNKYILGNTLFKNTTENLVTIKSILGVTDKKFISINDKVTLEILSCGYDYFIYSKEENKDNNVVILKLYNLSIGLTTSKYIKDKCYRYIKELEDWKNDQPKRENEKLIKKELRLIESKKYYFQNIVDEIKNKTYPKSLEEVNSNFLIIKGLRDTLYLLKPEMLRIKNLFSDLDDIVLSVGSSVVENSLTIINFVNNIGLNCFSNGIVPERKIYTSILQETVQYCLDSIFCLELFIMNSIVKRNYQSALLSIKSTANQYSISPLSTEDKLEIEKKRLKENIVKEIVESEININDIKNKSYFVEEITAAKELLEKHLNKKVQFIKWKNQNKIDEQNKLITKLIEKGEREREAELKVEQTILDNLKLKLKKID